MTDPHLLAEALAWYQAGALPIPVSTDGHKRPGVRTWTGWQDTRPDVGTVIDLFTQGDTDGLGLICGAASGGLELVELEGRAVEAGGLERLEQHFADHDLLDLWRLLGTYTEITPSGGVHWLLRVTDGPAARNTKLARTADGIVLAETRGQGGFVVIAPSAGRTHPSGQPWELLAGQAGVVAQVSVAQRQAIHDMIALLDEYEDAHPAPAMPQPSPRPAPTGDELRPGDDFNTRTSWDEILRPAGWTPMHTDGTGRRYWCRPGKHPRDGHSASTGGADDGVDRLWVFSSSAAPFEPEQPYTKFAAWALLEGVDHAEAARRLRGLGYGSERPEPIAGLTLLPGGIPTVSTAIHAPMAPAGVATLAPPVAVAVTSGSLALAVVADDEPEEQATTIAVRQTEDDIARALVARCADRMRYCPQRSQWLTWTGSRWAWDEGELHREHARSLARELPNGETWKKFRQRCLSANGIAGIVRLARTDPAVTVHIDDLDAQPWQLNTPGGIIDMRTGQLMPADREQLHTRTTSVTPDYTMPSPVWDRFLGDTFGSDVELIGFVQRLLGLSMVGEVLEQVLPFAIGPGANGKSTLFELVMRILGKGERGYSLAAQSEMLMVRRHSEHPAELAQLAGGRMVVLAEIEDGERFAEARVKQLTGADSVNARFMRGNPFTFTPSHTMWLVGNNQPNATVGGPAFWRRILLIRFDHVVPKEKRDPGLAAKLDAEAPAVLAWIARGAADYAQGGLRVPASVKAATSAYEDSQDTLAGFVEEACHVTASSVVQVKASDLRAAYERWCLDTGDVPASAKRFSLELQTRWGVTTTKGSKGVRYYRGITLLQEDDGQGQGVYR